MINVQITFDEAYQFIKLYDILRDMDMPLTEKQMSVFEKIQTGDYPVSYTHLTLPTIYSV